MTIPGPLSALAPAGVAAERIATLFWIMTAGAFLIWAALVILAIFVIRVSPGTHNLRHSRFLIVGGGVIFPTIVLAALLLYGLALLPRLLAPAPEGSLKITVTGLQWWWRVHYPTTDGNTVELANEVVLPVNEPVTFELLSSDVIHAFWIPSLGGKVDMIPGRPTRLTLEPTREGVYRGACAEYCGGPHALMNFHVKVVSRPEFDAWLARQSSPASPPPDESAQRGAHLFQQLGCGACHQIRGTPADGVLGPDLTHFGSRSTIGAGLLPNQQDSRRRWLTETAKLKPGVHMPAFHMLPSQDLDALATYLGSLQ